MSAKCRSAVISGKSLTTADPQDKPDMATAHLQSKRGDVSHAWALLPALTTPLWGSHSHQLTIWEAAKWSWRLVLVSMLFQQSKLLLIQKLFKTLKGRSQRKSEKNSLQKEKLEPEKSKKGNRTKVENKGKRSGGCCKKSKKSISKIPDLYSL